MKRILVATSDTNEIAILQDYFSSRRLDHARSKTAFREHLTRHVYDWLFVDLNFLVEKDNGMDAYRGVLQDLWSNNPHIQTVVLCGQEDIRGAVQVVKAGADSYLTRPVEKAEVGYVVESVLDTQRLQTEVDFFRAVIGVDEHSEVVGTKAASMRQVFEKARLVAPTISTVLLTGETGTGKGVIARLIHSISNRKEGPFVSVHCGAIPDTLIESELFGHEKGAFTGAVKRKLGRFEIATGGTTFLDEVGTLTASAQIKLLQVLQEKTYQRVGGDTSITMDSRIIAATNIDLTEMCDRGDFRSDLFFRLNVFPIGIPPLRERKEDIPLLAEYFLRRMTRLHLKDVAGIHPTVLEAFSQYAWPGNVRELENLMERAYILETSHVLTPESFPVELFEQDSAIAAMPLDLSLTLGKFRERAKEHAERHYLKELLTRHKGRINRSAESAGISTRQLHKLMTRHGLRKEDFK